LGLTTLNGLLNAISTDVSAATLEMDTMSANSTATQAGQATSTIVANLPNPPTTTCVTTTTGVTASDGESLLDVTLAGVPDTIDYVALSWSTTALPIETDDFGYVM
jgi:hypothetical protein